MIDIRQLRYFARVAELGSFSRAAAELRIAQSALSYQIGGLEDELGVTLLNRHRRGVTLTEPGRSVLEHAQRVMLELSELRVDAGARAQYPSGHVLFAAPPSVARVIAPQVIERFRKKYPDVRLSMREGTADVIYDWLTKAQIDLGLMYDLQATPDVQTAALVEDRMYLIGSARLPKPRGRCLPIAVLKDLPLVLTSTAHGWRRRFEKALAERDMQPNILAEVDSLSVIKELIKRGFAYSFLPRSAVHLELQSRELWAMEAADLSPGATLMLVSAANRAPSLATQELRSLIVEEARRLGVASDKRPPAGIASKRPLTGFLTTP